MLVSMNFVEDQGIDFVHLGTQGRKTPWKPISEDVVIATLDMILDPENYPLHIMCHLGRHRTGRFALGSANCVTT